MNTTSDLKQNTAVSYKPILLAIIFGAFFTSLGTNTISTAIPFLMSEFNSELTTVQWTMTFFMLATGIMAPITKFLGDQYGYKKIYLVSLIGFTVSSLLCALSPNIYVLIGLRTLQGAFNGVAIPATMTIVYQLIPKKHQAFSISMWSMASMLAPAFGPTVSGFLLVRFGWQSIFLMNLPFGLIAITMVAMMIPSYSLTESRKLDMVGFITCIAASLLLLTAFSQATNWGWTSSKLIICLVLGLAFLAVFTLYETRHKAPLLNLSIFRVKDYALSMIVRSFIMLSLYSGALLMPLFLQRAQGLSAFDAGLILLPSSLAMALSMIIVGKIYNRMNPSNIALIGILLIVVGSFMLTGLSLTTSPLSLILSMSIRNIGIAFATAPITNIGMTALPRSMSGDGSSVNNWVNQTIGSLGIAVFSSILTYQIGANITRLASEVQTDENLEAMAMVLGVNRLFLYSAIIAAIAVPLTWLLKQSTKSNSIIKQAA